MGFVLLGAVEGEECIEGEIGLLPDQLVMVEFRPFFSNRSWVCWTFFIYLLGSLSPSLALWSFLLLVLLLLLLLLFLLPSGGIIILEWIC